MCLSTGLALGSQGNILLRLTKIRGSLQPATVTASQPSHFQREQIRPVSDDERIKYCRQCGSKIHPGDRFCRSCREQIG
jgi:hypothetical protein